MIVFFIGYAQVKAQSLVSNDQFTYPNLNKKAYYQNYKELNKIKRYYAQQKWNLVYPLLFQYINQFGIENFHNNTDLLAMMAEACLKRGDISTVKNMLRLLIRHYRDNLPELLKKYEQISLSEKEDYADLEYYHSVLKRGLLDHDETFDKKSSVNIAPYVNTKYDDYGVAVGKGIDTIYFTSDRIDKKKAILMDIDNYSYEDIYISVRYGDSLWSTPKVFEPTKTKYKEGSPFLSDDHLSFYFSRCDANDGFGNCDIYVIERTSEGIWGEARNLGNKVNSYDWDSHPSLSYTGDTLFFSSSRWGGFGDSDIYYSVKDSLGQWQKAHNAGPIINTQQNEISPFFHRDYNVLYFSSNGQVFSFGEYDIYKSYLDEGNWSEPENLGPFINELSSDIYFTMDKKANWFFYAQPDNQNFKNHDLQCFLLPMEAKPNDLIHFTGKVIEPNTGKVFQGTVTIVDIKDRIPIAPKKVKADGTFEFKLLDKKEYLIVIEGDNFFRMEELFYLNGENYKVFKVKDIRHKITFRSIDFAKNSSEIMPQMENNLHLIINHLKTHESHHLSIIGHTDLDGDSEKNIQLSLDRAKSIKDYITVYGGILSQRIHSIGKGNEEPIVSVEKNETDKRLNRRVEFEIFNENSCTYH